MTLKRALLFLIPIALMLMALWGLTGIETWLASIATTQKAYLLLGRIGLTLPFLVSAGLGLIVLFSARGSLDIKWAGFGVLTGGLLVLLLPRSWRRCGSMLSQSKFSLDRFCSTPISIRSVVRSGRSLSVCSV